MTAAQQRALRVACEAGIGAAGAALGIKLAPKHPIIAAAAISGAATLVLWLWLGDADDWTGTE